MRIVVATLILLAGAHLAQAQVFPTRPVTLVVPQPPGGANDRTVRLIGERLQQMWGQSVVVDFKPGGGVIVGSQYVARSAPDGHTIGLITGAHTINPAIRKDMPYDPIKDFAPVARVGFYIIGLVAHPSLPARNVAELVALAKQKPGELQYGSNGIGTSAHFSGEMLKSMAGIDLQHIPYNGGAPLYRDMTAGRVPLAFAIMGSAMPHVQQGRMKLLALTNPARSEVYPEVPVVAETIPGFEMTTWVGFAVPAATPAPLVQRISADIVKVLLDPELRRQFATQGLEPAHLPAAEFEAFVRADLERMRRVVQQSGIKVE
ncbi:MAG: Bug family tripartite tricarboxylate transporter substrate binding protein [Betaproteobacteria bacterium]